MSDVVHTLHPREPSDRLQVALADYIAKTKERLAFQAEDRAVVITGHPVNHFLHPVLTIITAGLWIFIWVIASAGGGERSHILTVADDGDVLI